MSRQRSPLTVFSLLLIAALACGGSSVDIDATTTALAALINATATAAEPAAVAENGGGGESSAVQTAEANATAVAESVAATQAAVAAEQAAAQAATAAAVAPIMSELPTYGVDPSQGRTGWIHPPTVLDIDGYLQYDYVNQYIATVAQDFAVAADITWNTWTGISGCGFAVRAISGGEEEKFTGYLIVATRGATGHVGFIVVEENEFVDGLDIYARGIDRNFRWRNDTTNRLAVVGRGYTFTFFTNGVEIGQFTAPEAYRYDKGFVAMVGLSESGATHCEFSNTWLWLMN